MAVRFSLCGYTGNRELEACLAALHTDWQTESGPPRIGRRVLHSLGVAFARVFTFILVLTLVIGPPLWARAGGPRDIAGTVYFESPVKGTPLTWAQGTISYYTDRGALSPILPEAAADALVADAFSRWTSISTAAIVAEPAGKLGE